MSVIKNEAVAPAESGTVFTPFVVGAALCVVGSVGFISMNGLPPREASVHPVNIGAGIVATVGCLILGFALAMWPISLPRWARLTAAAGVWFAGATAWAMSTTIVAAATKTSNEVFDDLFFGSAWVLGGMAPKSVLCLVGFLGLAVAGWRQRTIPRAAAVAFGVAAVLSVWPPYPPGLIVFAIGVLIVARAHRGATDS